MKFDIPAVMLRPGTMDEHIFDDVLVRNEYDLPDRLAPDDPIIDIGAHIGCFCLAAGMRGSRRIVAVEPNRANFAIALINLKQALKHGHVRLRFGAVWRSDDNDDVLRCGPFPIRDGLVNTGGGAVTPGGTGATVPKLALDSLMFETTQGGRTRVRLLKIDCEGSEWPILLTSNRLDLVDEIIGEFHEVAGRDDCREPPWRIKGYTRFTSDVLHEALARAGFHVEIQRNTRDPHSGLLFARR
jgi:FkbM family methyltransferase